MYTEVSTGIVGHKAVLVSPQYQQASSTCRLSFKYHMYGYSINFLRVFVNDGTYRTRIWSLKGIFYVEQVLVFVLWPL